MNPWPYLGESSKMAEKASAPRFTESEKIMNRKRMEAMQNNLMGSNLCLNDDPISTFWHKYSPNNYKYGGYKEGTGGDSFYSFSGTDPWSTNQLGTGIANQYMNPNPIFTYNNDALFGGNPPPEVDIYMYDVPWSKISDDVLETWLPPLPNRIEDWYMDPVEVAAHRYEWRGFFSEASKLRMRFGPLSLLHRWVLQWYLWAEKQEVLKVTSSSKGKAIETRVGSREGPSVKFSQYPERKVDTNQKDAKLDPGHFDKSFHGKEPPLESFEAASDEVKNTASLIKDENKGESNKGPSDIPSGFPTNTQTYEYYTENFDLANIDGPPLQPCVLDTERIVPQILKDRAFRSSYSDNHQSLKETYTDGVFTNGGDSIAYKNHARWVLENNLMSEDSEEDDTMNLSTTATHHVFNKLEKILPGEHNGPLAQKTGCTPAENRWSDLFFLEDSESSDCFSSNVSVSSEDSEFPIISGEELEIILEEAKGTVQFHKWQNAPASMHQKEFKNLINLHRFAKESEAKNQKSWRSRENAEKSRRIKTTRAKNTASQSPGLIFSSYKSPPLPSNVIITPILKTFASNNDLPALSRDPESERQLAKESQYTYITPEDIRFLKELKRKFTQGEFIQKTRTNPESTLPSETTIKSSPKKQLSGNISLRDILLTAKPPPGISYRIGHEYGNWFFDHDGERANSAKEQSQKHYDGPVPKRHHMTTPFGDVNFYLENVVESHPFSQVVKSPFFKKLVISTGRLWNPGAKISLSGFWVTESLFITALNFHSWAPGTAVSSLQDQIEDFESRNNEIDTFVSNSYINWFNPSEDPETIRVTLRAWDISARLAIFEPEDKRRAAKSFVGIDTLIEEDEAYGYSGLQIATVGYNPLDAARDDSLGLRLLIPDHRSVTFGDITISEGLRGSTFQSPPTFARLDPGFSHGSYGRMCIVMEGTKDSSFVIGIVSGQCEERGVQWPEALSDFVSTFPSGFKAELKRLLKS